MRLNGLARQLGKIINTHKYTYSAKRPHKRCGMGKPATVTISTLPRLNDSSDLTIHIKTVRLKTDRGPLQTSSLFKESRLYTVHNAVEGLAKCQRNLRLPCLSRPEPSPSRYSRPSRSPPSQCRRVHGWRPMAAAQCTTTPTCRTHTPGRDQWAACFRWVSSCCRPSARA